jgi:hypothetical protein
MDSPTTQSQAEQPFGDSFFNCIDRSGYPAANAKKQPWTKYTSLASLQNTKQQVLAENGMTVVLGKCYDYGTFCHS